MWLVTETGFISVVQKKTSDERLTVRSRDPHSLLAVCEKLGLDPVQKISLTLDTDYPYRMWLTREQVQDFVVDSVENIDYSNFKDRITDRRGRVWHDALMNVWCSLLAVEPRRVLKMRRDHRMLAKNAG
jgi:hypothetical protein